MVVFLEQIEQVQGTSAVAVEVCHETLQCLHAVNLMEW